MSSCDSAGLAVLIGAERRARVLGTAMRLAAPSIPEAQCQQLLFNLLILVRTHILFAPIQIQSELHGILMAMVLTICSSVRSKRILSCSAWGVFRPSRRSRIFRWLRLRARRDGGRDVEHLLLKPL